MFDYLEHLINITSELKSEWFLLILLIWFEMNVCIIFYDHIMNYMGLKMYTRWDINDNKTRLIVRLMLYRSLRSLAWNGIPTIQKQWVPYQKITENCGLRMRLECQENFPPHRHQRKLVVSDPSMHHGTCVTRPILWMLLTCRPDAKVISWYTYRLMPIRMRCNRNEW